MRRLENPGLRTFAESEPLVLDGAQGSWLSDPSGKRYLDLSGLSSVSIIGHGHEAVVNAVREQAGKLMHCPSGFPSEVRAQFLEAVESIVPRELNSIMPSITGGMANEIAVAMARTRRPKGRMISFTGSYYGRSVGVVGYNGKSKYRHALEVDAAAQFLPYPNPLTMGPNATDQVMDVLRLLAGPGGGMGEIAGIMMEPMQGNAGVIIPPPDFMPRLREFCDQTGALLITDEIQCGNGRTGKMWAAEHWSVTPDILTIGKGIGGGMPVTAVAARAEFVKWKPDSYSATLLTNQVSLAASIATLGVMKKEKLAERAGAIGPKYHQRLKQHLSGLSGVSEVRGIGLWYAVELATPRGLPDSQAASQLLVDLRKEGVVVQTCGYAENVIKISPALTIDEDDLSNGIDTIISGVKDWSAKQ